MTEERSSEVAGLVVATDLRNGLAVVALSGNLAVENADELARELQRIEAGGVGKIVLDLRHLDFIDSTGVRVIYNAAVRLRDGDRLSIVPGAPAVQRVFAAAGMERAFPFTE